MPRGRRKPRVQPTVDEVEATLKKKEAANQQADLIRRATQPSSHTNISLRIGDFEVSLSSNRHH